MLHDLVWYVIISWEFCLFAEDNAVEVDESLFQDMDDLDIDDDMMEDVGDWFCLEKCCAISYKLTCYCVMVEKKVFEFLSTNRYLEDFT